MNRNQIPNALLLTMVLVSVFAGSVAMGSGTAAAENVTTSEAQRECSEVGLFAFLNPGCQPYYGEGHVADVNGKKSVVYGGVPINGRTAEQIHYDMYIDGTIMADSTKQFVVEAESHSNQTVALAYSEAWNAAVKVRNQGGSKGEAQKAAADAVNDFYAMQEKSLFVQQNRQALRLKVMTQTLNETGGLATDGVLLVPEWGEQDAGFRFSNATVTLWNGDEMNVTIARYYNPDTGSGWVDESGYHCYAPYDPATGCQTSSSTAIADWIQMKSPQGKTITIMDGRNSKKSYQLINDNRQQALDNTDLIVDGIWANCDVGECQPSDLGPIHLIYSMSSSYDSTGYYGPAAGILGSMGYSGNVSMAYNITWDNTGPNGNVSAGPPEMTAQGQMWRTPGTFPNGTATVNTMYNASELNGSVYYIYQDGSLAREVTFNGTFVINSMTNTKTGEAVNVSHSQDTSFDTTSTEDLIAQINDLLDRMKDIEKQQGDGGGGFSVPGWFTDLVSAFAIGGVAGSTVLVVLIIVSGLAYLYVITA